MSKMAKGTVRLQLTAAQVSAVRKALKGMYNEFTEKELKQVYIVLAKLKK